MRKHSRTRLFSTFTVLFTLAFSATSCAVKPNNNRNRVPAYYSSSLHEIEKEILEANHDLAVESGEGTGSRPKIPMEINENVRKWIHYFSVKDRERFRRFLIRGNRYRDLVKDTLRSHGVPTELYYLAMIESGYALHARSHASAVGPWQFIRGTGLRYGLQQDAYLDERRDIVRATDASARYLKGLHSVFDNWYLAMAGYNAGEGRILGAIMRGKSRDFWELADKKVLPAETRDYVPKFLAAAIIGKHPERFGFRDLDAEPFPKVTATDVPGGVSLQLIAAKAGISLDDMKNLNPHLIRNITPPNRSTYPVWIPSDRSAAVVSARAEFEKNRQRPGRTLAGTSTETIIHSVRRGETLSSIARRYHTSVPALRSSNNLRRDTLSVGQKLRIGDSPSRTVANRAPSRNTSSGQNVSQNQRRQAKPVVHRVRRGEALGTIARKYGVPVQKIKRLNDLESSKIFVGQRLVVSRGL